MISFSHHDLSPPPAAAATRTVAPGGARRAFAARAPLFCEGDEKTSLYEIEQGCVKLYRTLIDGQRQVVGFATAGDVLGLEPGVRHLNSAEAVNAVRVRAIAANQIGELCRREPGFAEALLHQAGRQLAAAQMQLAQIGAQTADQRIAGFLLSLADPDAEGPVEIDLPMRRGDIAEFLGLRLETVSRKFSEFQRRGWIRLTSLYHCVLRRPDILTELAEGGEAPHSEAA